MGLLDRLVVRGERDNDRDETLKRRLQVLPTADLPLWLDNTISHTGKAVQDYLRDGDPAQLKEARMAAESLVSLICELERRTAGT